MKIIKEKTRKIKEYIQLESLFVSDSEFKRVHPEIHTLWKKKFRQMIRYSAERTFPIVEEFLSVQIICCKKGFQSSNEKKPILICAVKDEVDKIKYFMEHYRAIGIEEFLILDNDSTDGTFEFLKEQADVTLYQCKHGFTANRKIAWMNRLLAERGDNHWFLMVDSDELVDYIERDNHPIDDVVAVCEKKGYERLQSVMIDMYPKGALFGTDMKNLYQDYCYMDQDSYYCQNLERGIRITGGPRRRVFGTQMTLSKCCLFYFAKDDVIPSAHFVIPYEKNQNVPIALAMLHYKFVNKSDYKKVLEAVETGMHSCDSAEYKTYLAGIEKKERITFYDEGQSILYSLENLEKIKIIKNIFRE